MRLEAVWLGGRAGRANTVGAYVNANRGRGAVGGINGDFFILARNVPSGNLFIHRGQNFLGNTERGAANSEADMRVLGAILIVLGIVVLALRGISYTKKEKVLDAGPFQASTTERRSIPLSPVAGGVAVVAGLVLVLAARRNS